MVLRTAAPFPKNEIIGGLTTFLSASYIVVVNPSILSTEGTGLSFSATLTATVLLCFLLTTLMGLYAKLPYVVAPGMGINAYFTYSMILGAGVAWPAALSVVFWSGVIFLVLSVTPVRQAIVNAIPKNLRLATAGGIGLFLSFIGLKNAGIIQANPATLVSLAPFNVETAWFFISLIVSLYFVQKKSPLAFLIGILTYTGLAAIGGKITMPESLFATPDFSLVGQLDWFGAFELALLPLVISLFFTDLFDSISTFIGVSQATGMVDDKGEPKNLRKGLIVDSLATLFGGPLGTSSGTAYIESAAGIHAGARTGKAAIICGLCFLPFLFFAPLLQMIPVQATSAVLVLVGTFMFRSILQLNHKAEEVIPAFFTILLIPLTFSITHGILWGFIIHALMFVMAGRHKELSPIYWGIVLTSVGLLFLH